MGYATDPVDAAGADPDLAWCHEVVQEVSRTFAITVDILEEPMDASICLGYLLCRIPDTIEDAGHIPPEAQARLLGTYDSVLDPESETTPTAFTAAVEEWVPNGEARTADWELVAESERVLAVFDRQPEAVKSAIRPPARELVGGMATFIDRYAEDGGLRLQNRAELHEYCHYAAGTVGELITNLVCDESTPEETRSVLDANAESFGLALQLVNIAKDVGADFREENNVYLPADELSAHGVPPSAVCDPEHEAGVVAVVETTVADARECLDDAQTYLEHVPERDGNRVAAWAVPFLLAVATLRAIEDRPEQVRTVEGVKVSRSEVAAVIEHTVGADDPDLDALRKTIADGPLD